MIRSEFSQPRTPAKILAALITAAAATAAMAAATAATATAAVPVKEGSLGKTLCQIATRQSPANYVKDNCVQYSESKHSVNQHCAMSFPNASFVTVTKGDSWHYDSLLIDGTERVGDMDAKTILVHRDIVYKEGRRRYDDDRRRYDYDRRRYGYGGDAYHRRRRSSGQKQSNLTKLCEINVVDRTLST
eukprot:s4922_g2.t1